MMIAALGTLLVGQLPQDTALSMVWVVGTSLVLALLCGVLALRVPEAVPQPPPAARVVGEIAPRS